MTLRNDRPGRPPMGPRARLIWILGAVAVLAFVVVVVIVSGQSFF